MKTVALGTILWVVNPATVGNLAVGNLTQINVPGPVKPEIDVTDFDSLAAEFLAGLPDNGELAFTGWFNYEDEGQMLVLADAHNPEAPTRTFRIDFVRQDVSFTFEGWVKSFVPNAPGPQEAYSFDGSIRVTGAVTITSPIPA
jgi:hypothetical protein